MKTGKPARKGNWTQHLGSMLATSLIFISGSAFLSLLDAFR